MIQMLMRDICNHLHWVSSFTLIKKKSTNLFNYLGKRIVKLVGYREFFFPCSFVNIKYGVDLKHTQEWISNLGDFYFDFDSESAAINEIRVKKKKWKETYRWNKCVSAWGLFNFFFVHFPRFINNTKQKIYSQLSEMEQIIPNTNWKETKKKSVME